MTHNQDGSRSVWDQVRGLYRQSFERSVPAARAARRAQQRDQALANRLSALEVAFQAAPHYCEQAFLEQHAKTYADDLYTRRDEIRDKYAAFYRDEELVTYLTDHAPHLLAFVKWEVNALAEAEKYLVAGANDRREPLTPEEKAERIRRFRERAVERERTRIDDETAMAFVAFESVEDLLDAREAKIQEIRARDDLDDSEKEERIRGIRAVTEKRLDTMLGGEKPHGDPQAPESAPVVLDE